MRNWDEIRDECLARIARNAPPFTGVDALDARTAIASIGRRDPDQWAAAWLAVGDRLADRAERATERDSAAAAWLRAWRAYDLGRWPAPTSRRKADAYRSALAAFGCYAAYADPPVETLRVRSGRDTVVAYLRLPPGGAPAPLVLAISGLDSRKEDDLARHSPDYLAHGIGLCAVDMPGTGEAPSPNAPDAERHVTALLDALAARADIDARRIVVRGRSWGSYHAVALAHREPRRLAGAVAHGAPVHHYFSAEWQRRALATPEYLFDHYEALAAMAGVQRPDQYFEWCRGMSLESRGVLDSPSAPMLVANGARDTICPHADTLLLLERGSAKDAWINPAGAHMGRSPEWPQTRIVDEVIQPWIVRRIGAPASGA